MRCLSLSRLLPILVALAAVAAGAEKAVSPNPALNPEMNPTDLKALRSKLGETIIVEGQIARAGESRSKSHRYLNFTQNYRQSVSLVFPVAKNPAEFTLETLGQWVGRRVRATEKLTEYRGALQIEISNLKQLNQAAAKADPAPAEKPAALLENGK